MKTLLQNFHRGKYSLVYILKLFYCSVCVHYGSFSFKQHRFTTRDTINYTNLAQQTLHAIYSKRYIIDIIH